MVIEAGRGIAALEVFLFHICEIFGLHTSEPWNYVLKPFLFGHEAVIAFFVLSGFSIHYSHGLKQLDTRDSICRFYFLRILRLQPILFVGLCLTVFFTVVGNMADIQRYSTELVDGSFGTAVLGAFIFLNGGLTAPISTNLPLWSLPYEALYYLIYPLFWYLYSRRGITFALGFSFLISVVALASKSVASPNHVTSIISLYGVWATGCLLAEYTLSNRRLKINYPMIMALISFLLILRMFLRDIASTDVNDYLFTLILFGSALVYQGRDNLIKSNMYTVGGFTLVGVLVVVMLSLGPAYWDYKGSWILLIIKSAVLILLFSMVVNIIPTNWVKAILNYNVSIFYKTGRFSYALYVLHFPILIAAKEFMQGVFGTPFIIFISFTITLPLAWAVECVWYPKTRTSILRLLNRYNS